MAKAPTKPLTGRALADKVARQTRDTKARLRRLVKDQREIQALAKQLRSAQGRTADALESLRGWLDETSADAFAAAGARRDEDVARRTGS